MTDVHASQPRASSTRAPLLPMVFLCAAFLVPPALAQSDAAVSAAGHSSTASAPSSRDKLAALKTTSGDLVEKLKTGKVDAANFRIQVVLYRESLRDLMLADQHAAAAEQLPRPVLMELVRMAALLQAAANCETGRYLVCPADLMDRLRLQQKTVASAVDTQTHSE
jgi:hypothetical protein